MAWRGLPGTRSMVFSNINDVTSHLLHGISWCLCKYKVAVMQRFRRFVWGSRFCGLWAYLWADFDSDWTVGILRKLPILRTMLISLKGTGLRFNAGPRQCRGFDSSPSDVQSALTTE